MSINKAANCILCTICAREGSKGLSGKNVRPLLGKPLIAYTIQQAISWGKARRIVVSTDSQEIAAIAREYGACVPFERPKRLAKDNAAKLPSVRHALIKSEKFFGERYDIIVDLDITAPIRKVEDLDNCLNIFIKKKPKSLFSVVKARKNPYFNMVEENKNGFVRLSKELPQRITRRQDAPKVYSMNASIYFYSRDFLLDAGCATPFSDRTVIYVMDELSKYDIDTKADFEFIEFLIRTGIWQA